MTDYIIPLTPEPQSFAVVLAGKEYRLTIRWMSAAEGGWMLDIQEADKAAPIVMGIPLVTGCDLLEQYSYMEFGGMLWLNSDLPPTPDNLGTEVELMFSVEDA